MPCRTNSPADCRRCSETTPFHASPPATCRPLHRWRALIRRPYHSSGQVPAPSLPGQGSYLKRGAGGGKRGRGVLRSSSGGRAGPTPSVRSGRLAGGVVGSQAHDRANNRLRIRRGRMEIAHEVLPGHRARRSGAYPPGTGEVRSSQPGRKGAHGRRREAKPGAGDPRAGSTRDSQVSGATSYVRAPERTFYCLC